MNDYIKREDARERLKSDLDRFDHVPQRVKEFFLLGLENVPSADVVKVVRCKDCKYRYLSGVGKQHYVCDFLDAELKNNGYCSYGERRDDDFEYENSILNARKGEE